MQNGLDANLTNTTVNYQMNEDEYDGGLGSVPTRLTQQTGVSQTFNQESGSQLLTDADREQTAIDQNEGSPKMNVIQAYFGLIKAYCAINVLLLPKAFKNGGWLLSPIALTVACIFEATCAIKLAQCSLFTGTISY